MYGPVSRPFCSHSLFATQRWQVEEFFVICEGGAVQAGLDDPAAFGHEVVFEEGFDFPVEERFQDFCTLVVGFGTDFRLVIHFEEPIADRAAFDDDGAGRVAEKRAAGGLDAVGLKAGTTAPGEVFAGDPLGHEANIPDADVLVGDEDIAHAIGALDLLQQEVGLIDAPPGGKGPVGAHAFGGHAFGLDDARIGMATGSDESPQPGKGRGEDVQESDDAVGGIFSRAGRRAHTHATNIDIDRAIDDVGNNAARDNDPGIRTGLAGFVLNMLPNQRGGTGLAVNIQKQQGFSRSHGEAFQVRIDAIPIDMIAAQEPGIFGIDKREPALVLVEAGVTKGHVVGDGMELAPPRQGVRALFAGENIATKQQTAVGEAVDLLEHFAFATTAGTFVRDDDLILVGRDNLYGGAVHGDPLFLFPQIEQHSVDAFFGTGSGIEVVAEQLVMAFQTIVDDNLPAVKMGVTEGRGDVNNRLG